MKRLNTPLERTRITGSPPPLPQVYEGNIPPPRRSRDSVQARFLRESRYRRLGQLLCARMRIPFALNAADFRYWQARAAGLNPDDPEQFDWFKGVPWEYREMLVRSARFDRRWKMARSR